MFHHSEGRGHNMLLTAANGTLAEQNEYDAFGRPYFFNASGQPQTASNYGNRFLFTGREYLSELKLYDYRARMYQPELGRFMQPDPKQFEAGDYNLYRYCHNDPVNRSDPMGLSSLTMFGGGDWIKGSDGLSAWDREIGGMPSNRWQAGEQGAGGGGRGSGDGSTRQQVVKQKEGFPPVDPQAAYKAAQTAVPDVKAAILTSQKTESKVEVLQTKTGEYIVTKVHPGDGIQPDDRGWAQRSTVSNSDNNLHLVGYVVGYAYYSSRYAQRDLANAAKDPHLAVAILVFKYNGQPTVLPYVKPQPVPVPP
jgi:RHS repeat-associated protein